MNDASDLVADIRSAIEDPQADSFAVQSSSGNVRVCHGRRDIASAITGFIENGETCELVTRGVRLEERRRITIDPATTPHALLLEHLVITIRRPV